MISLLRRLVIALESIAASLAKIVSLEEDPVTGLDVKFKPPTDRP